MGRLMRIKKNRFIYGFTIIEVMIVLAIAGLILLIVFLAVPALQRSARNHERKEALSIAWSLMHEYYNNHGRYPINSAGTDCTSASCISFINSIKAAVPGGWNVEYVDNNKSHKYPYDSATPEIVTETIVIFPGHRCNRTAGLGPGSADYPVHTIGSTDNDFRRFAIYIGLEPSGNVICSDDIN